MGHPGAPLDLWPLPCLAAASASSGPIGVPQRCSSRHQVLTTGSHVWSVAPALPREPKLLSSALRRNRCQTHSQHLTVLAHRTSQLVPGRVQIGIIPAGEADFQVPRAEIPESLSSLSCAWCLDPTTGLPRTCLPQFFNGFWHLPILFSCQANYALGKICSAIKKKREKSKFPIQGMKKETSLQIPQPSERV